MELDRIRHDFGYQTDGAVVKVDAFSQREILGSPRNRRAGRSPSNTKRSEWRHVAGYPDQVGRTGTLTPVAALEPVTVGGSRVARATLHNEEEIERKDIRIGDTVVIEKAGEVIPAVVNVRTDLRTGSEKKFRMPKLCPECGSAVVKDEGQVRVRCVNSQCPGRCDGALSIWLRGARWTSRAGEA